MAKNGHGREKKARAVRMLDANLPKARIGNRAVEKPPEEVRRRGIPHRSSIGGVIGGDQRIV